MGKKSSDAPAAPDPKLTSAAQTGTNVATALANTSLQNVNRIGADGSTLTYAQTGGTSFTDPYTGQTYNLPTFTATEKLSPQAQAIFNATQGTKLNLANTANNQSAAVGTTLSSAWNPNTTAIEARLNELGKTTLDPQFANQRSDLATQLSNQGIKLGSDAYTRAMTDLGNTQNQQYNDLYLRGRGQAFNELQTIRNQPLNELSALLSGSQVSMPGYNVNTPSSIPTTDNAALINNAYNQNLAAWQTEQQRKQSMWGGLLGVGSAIALGM